MEPQLTFGDVEIDKIKTDPKSRDEIDRTVRGLQYIFTTDDIRQEIFSLLESSISPKVSKKTGRPGMHLWKILVFGVIRQACSWDYDKLHHQANNNLMIRELLGHPRSEWSDGEHYELQTLKDNVMLLTPELIDKISEIVVKAGHNLLGGKKKEELNASTDSFVVLTDVHYPTDIHLLFDSMRKSISLIAALYESCNMSGWRQYKHNINTLKRELRRVQKAKHSVKSTTDEKIKKAHAEYISKATYQLAKVNESIEKISSTAKSNLSLLVKIVEIEQYMKYAEQHIKLIDCRVIRGEVIPHSDKIFSIFEPHTRWISKGKAGVPVELGLPVSIVKDQHGYILSYEIMETTSDSEVALPLMQKVKSMFPAIKSSSYDKGYWSPSNREGLSEVVETVVLPKKGRLNKKQMEEENSGEFVKYRKKHSAVESSINALGHCGLDTCYDHGAYGFKRCVALSVLARNINVLGKHIREKEIKKSVRKIYTKSA